YINLQDQTEERFLVDPFTKEHGRMFRSGDLGRLLPNGTFEIMGRQDSQVKLKGYRIELDEVAEAIKQHPQVVSSAVIVKDKTHLVGYFTPATVDVEELKETVAAQLPTYMVPAVWVGLDVMPQNTNGKIDKKVLQAMDIVIEVKALQNETEELLASVWSQVLDANLCDIGRTTSFFALGGDSITAIRLVSKAKQAGLALTSAKVMKFPTLESMARVAVVITAQTSADAFALVTGDVPLTPIQHFNFNHPWHNIHYWNLSMSHQPRRELQLDELKDAVARLVAHHDMLRTRFRFSSERGWSQYIPDTAAAPVVDFVNISGFEALEDAVLAKEKSLHLIDGPVYAVTVFETPAKTQYLQFTLHHAIADLVSWRILLDDLQTVLDKKQLAPKTMSFKAWSEHMTTQALKWDPAAWDDYMGDDIAPPADRSSETIVHNQAILDAQTSMKLDTANAVYGTNVQELALAALTAAWAELRDASSMEGQKLHLMMEGHGREPWDATMDITSTVGWFTCEYPVVFTATDDVSKLVRQVKQKLRGLPNKGLSYGAIKYLVPKSADTERIKAHKRHNCSFNYHGRFQETGSDESLFDSIDGFGVPQKEANEADYFPGNILLGHHQDNLVLDMFVPDWIVTQDDSDSLCALWCQWMARVVNHCLDPSTIGGRTLSDVPLLQSSAVVDEVEAELLSTLNLRPLDIEDMYPLTPLQFGLLAAMIQDPSEYVLQSVFDIRGDFTFAQLESCWKKLTSDTPLLRTVFASTRQGLFQAVTKQDFSSWRLLDKTWSCDNVDNLTKEFMDRDRLQGFTLASKSFQRFTGVRVSDGRLRVFWTHHHAMMDGWSLSLIMDKWLAICYGETANATFVPFKDHVEWLSQQDPEPSRLFWKTALEHADKTLPLGLPKPTELKDHEKYKTLDRQAILPDMDAACKQMGVTPSSLFRAAWAIVLQQYTRSEHVMFGSVVSGRDTGLDGVDKIIGMLINTVPVMAHVQPSSRLVDLVANVHSYSMDLNQHSHCSLVDIKREAGLSGQAELFDSILVYENFPASEFDAEEATKRPFTIDSLGGKEFIDMPVGVAIAPDGEKYHLLFSFSALTVDEQVVSYLADRFVHVVYQLGSTSLADQTVASLDIPMTVESALVQSACCGPQVPLPFELLHHAFESRAKTHPNLRAVEFEDTWLSYKELNDQANALAYYLTVMGVQPGSRVAVIMGRCLEFTIGLLAALKIGGVMVPVDATFPIQRISYMLSDANAAAIITTDAHVARLQELDSDIPVHSVSSEGLHQTPCNFKVSQEQIRNPTDEAYIVYTSGSTGKPKGVPVFHEGAVNAMMSSLSNAGFVEGARVMQFMAIGFDVCLWEIWKTLSMGATLVFRTEDLSKKIGTVDVLMCTPTALSLLGDPSAYPSLKTIFVGGEAIPSALKDIWCPFANVYNCYGPSECSITTHFGELTVNTRVDLGKPIENSTCYILDNAQRPVPIGVVGEMCLGGIGVCRGYINLPDQSAERFIADPFRAGGRMYRSGDLGRLLPNGRFEILGRQDTQVKLKGYRIELDEVAEAMMQHPGVIAAAA
ncbi:hypothetical protein As57867_003741, partial [Aphanomyces stellatus]